MTTLLPLTQLPLGQPSTVCRLNNTGSIRIRLQDVGIIQGTIIEPVLKSIFGNPIAYRIGTALIAIRHEDAAQIMVQPWD